MFDKNQWMQGNLEACMLKMIKKEYIFGYIIVQRPQV